MLWKLVYPYEYMDDCKKFDEILLPGKEDLYCHLNVEDVTSTYYLHAKRICKDFDVNNLGECHDLYVFEPWTNYPKKKWYTMGTSPFPQI